MTIEERLAELRAAVEYSDVPKLLDLALQLAGLLRAARTAFYEGARTPADFRLIKKIDALLDGEEGT